MSLFWKRGLTNKCYFVESARGQRSWAARSPVVWRAICLSLIVGLNCIAANGAESVTRDSVFAGHAVVPDVTWKETSSDEKWRIVTLLADHTQANFARIRTWKGTYRVRDIEGQPESYMKQAFGERVAVRDVSNVSLECAFTVEFAIDLPGRRIFRAKKTDLMYWRDGKTNEQFNVPNTASEDERSFVAGEEYVHFDPVVVWPGFNYIRNHPDARQKRAAFRELADKGKRKHYGGMLDPRAFFATNQNIPVWETLTFSLDSHKGKFGGGGKQNADKSVRVFEAEARDGKLYRFDVEFSGPQPGGPVVHSSLICQGSVDFHPIGYLLRNDGRKSQEMQWRWKSVDGIYLPEAVLEVFTAGGEQTMQLWRESELVDCSVNVPLDADQFSLQGLGLKEGELVVDKIDRFVGILRDGKTVRLGDFGTQYVAPSKGGQTPIRIVLVSANLLILIAALGWAMRRRRSARKG